MKKITFATILFFGVVSSSNAIKLDILTGDTKLACEAMLCLASPVKPPECGAALARYFSIDARKWADVIAKRRSFLNLCPVDASSDPEMYKYKNDILVHLDGECSVSALNNRVEDTLLRTETIQKCSHGDGCTTEIIKHYGYRINPQLTNSCKLLASSKYTDYHLKYTCDKKFYEQKDWERGYELKEVSQEIYNALPVSQREQGEKLTPISYGEFIKLPANKRKQEGFGKYYRIDIAYYQKIIIKKDCWINEK
ncbi:TrbM/KikA/MpfK family conjugal transfer protein [Campylobacter coli]|uniref:TrbM/KikA/MpfK family conjugal transfer protein n=1 Tax=Campylobacter coli TaxID=195 RepID=UPI00092FEF66|nr:TrbM/KikA/MpfK family conjugal transfer protein [Campylobacter coli]